MRLDEEGIIGQKESGNNTLSKVRGPKPRNKEMGRDGENRGYKPSLLTEEPKPVSSHGG